MGHHLNAMSANNGPTIWSEGTKQYGVFVDLAGDVIACQFDRATRALEATFALSGITGNPLSLPLDNQDNHETPSLAVAPDGFAYVTANNFLNATPRIVKWDMTGPIDTAANWSDASTGLAAGVAPDQVTYFKWAAFEDSVLLIYRYRHNQGTVDHGDSHMYRVDASGWTDLGQLSLGDLGTEDAFYRNFMYVEGPDEPHPYRGHLFGLWDYALGSVDAGQFSYLYTDDAGTTWRNIDDVELDLPISSTNPAGLLADTGFTFAGGDFYSMAGACVDGNGYPCGILADQSAGRSRLIRWNGTTWAADTLGNRYGNQSVNVFMWRGDLWTCARPLGVTGAFTSRAEMRRVAAPNERFHIMAPLVAGTNWYCHYDPIAHRETGTIEMLHVNDDVPRVVTAGDHARREAAA